MTNTPYVAPRPGDINYDAEFFHWAGVTRPISVGCQRHDRATYYAIDSSIPWDEIAETDPWVLKNVLSRLPQRNGRLDLNHPDVKPREQIKEELLAFAAPATQHGLRLWAAAAAYDHVVLGTMMGSGLMDWPSSEGWPIYTNDLYQELSRYGLTWDDLPRQEDGQHHSLADAKHLGVQREWLAQRVS